MNDSDPQLKTYDVTLILLNNEVMLNWQRANISLLGHSILILAWATIFAARPDYKGLLAAILVFGGLLCFLWLSAALSGNTYHSEWLAWLSHLESQLAQGTEKAPARLLKVWEKHDSLLKNRAINIDSKHITLCCFALGVKNYFKGLPILFMAIYLSLFVYLWYP